jgi:hypothetical protein
MVDDPDLFEGGEAGDSQARYAAERAAQSDEKV